VITQVPRVIEVELRKASRDGSSGGQDIMIDLKLFYGYTIQVGVQVWTESLHRQVDDGLQCTTVARSLPTTPRPWIRP